MAFDYTRFTELSERLVTKFGRLVTFVELGNVAANPAKPWLGAAGPRSAPTRSTPLMAVFVEPSSLDRLGKDSLADDFMKRSQQIALVYSAELLDNYNEILEADGSRWKITGFSHLKPGPTSLLYFVGAAR